MVRWAALGVLVVGVACGSPMRNFGDGQGGDGQGGDGQGGDRQSGSSAAGDNRGGGAPDGGGAGAAPGHARATGQPPVDACRGPAGNTPHGDDCRRATQSKPSG